MVSPKTVNPVGKSPPLKTVVDGNHFLTKTVSELQQLYGDPSYREEPTNRTDGQMGWRINGIYIEAEYDLQNPIPDFVTFTFESMQDFDWKNAFEHIGLEYPPTPSRNLMGGAYRWEPYGRYVRLTVYDGEKTTSIAR